MLEISSEHMILGAFWYYTILACIAFAVGVLIVTAAVTGAAWLLRGGEGREER